MNVLSSKLQSYQGILIWSVFGGNLACIIQVTYSKNLSLFYENWKFIFFCIWKCSIKISRLNGSVKWISMQNGKFESKYYSLALFHFLSLSFLHFFPRILLYSKIRTNLLSFHFFFSQLSIYAIVKMKISLVCLKISPSNQCNLFEWFVANANWLKGWVRKFRVKIQFVELSLFLVQLLR